ncbi:hypothetical protein STAFG_4256 [Streptomyces afghaniensis 772]|uniref:Uncharacterized protein n=1 Tax=Streptomyces afghaniensis 772 TaxID=1283301 RepID=S4MSZ5_9ACTN|nr:hypothetical protein STAFG_4256 [Streptomyces afghaniensis 772]
MGHVAHGVLQREVWKGDRGRVSCGDTTSYVRRSARP